VEIFLEGLEPVMEWTVSRGLRNASHSYQRNGFARCLRRQRDAYPFTNCIKIEAIAEPYIKRRAVRHLESRIVILEPEPETLILPLIQQLFAWCRNSCRRDFERNTSTAFMIQILKKMQMLQNLILFLLTT
jgi:hypothetical protein